MTDKALALRSVLEAHRDRSTDLRKIKALNEQIHDVNLFISKIGT